MLANAEEKQALDPRTARSRQMLEQAFADLMRERPFQSITVADIAARAGLNRATFYDHFVDKYDLLDYFIRSLFHQRLQDRLPASSGYNDEGLRMLIVTLCEMIRQLHGRCVPGDQNLVRRFESQVTTQIRDILLAWLVAAHGPRPGDAVLATIASWSIYGAARYWDQSDWELPAEAFAASVLPAIRASLESAPAAGGPLNRPRPKTRARAG